MLALAVYDRLKAMRRPGDSYTDVIIRVARG
jgi:predicted CopG family antitoxin